MKVIFLGSEFKRFEYVELSKLPFGNFNISIGDDANIGNFVNIGKSVNIGNGAEIGNFANIGNYAKIGIVAKLGDDANIDGYNYLCVYGAYKYTLVAYLDKNGIEFISLGCRNFTVAEWDYKIANNNFWTNEFDGTDEKSAKRMRAFNLGKSFLEPIRTKQ